MDFLDNFFYLQGINVFLAVLFNLILIYVAIFRTTQKTSFYKIMVVVYAFFEGTYAIVIFIGMPVHFVSKGAWIVFNNRGPLAGTQLSFLGPALYCIFYQIWIILIVSMFLYRYILVCRPMLSARIKANSSTKRIISFVYLFFIAFAFSCGLLFCTRLKMTADEHSSVIEDYELTQYLSNSKEIGYILLRAKDSHGTFSLVGLTTILNHHILVSTSCVIVLFCSYRIIQQIRMLETGTWRKQREAKNHKEIFFSLVIQTAIPFFFCHIPSVVFLAFPFLEASFSFGTFSLLFTWMTTVVKFVDPLIVLTCVPEYRRAVRGLFQKQSDSSITRINSGSVFTTGPHSTRSRINSTVDLD